MSPVITKKRVSATQAKTDVLSALKLDVSRAINAGYSSTTRYGKFSANSMESEIVRYMSTLAAKEKSNLYYRSVRALRTPDAPSSVLTRYNLKMENAGTVLSQLGKAIDIEAPLSVTTAALSSGSSSSTPRGGAPSISAGLDPNDTYKNYWDVDIKVRWSLEYVYCVDETDGFLGSEAGEDEIYIGGFGVDDVGTVTKFTKLNPSTQKYEPVDSFKIGDFDDTKAITNSKRKKVFLPPLQLAEFTIGSKKPMPLNYMTTYTLVESDGSGSELAKFFRKMFDLAGKKLIAEITDSKDIGAVLAELWQELGKWLIDLFFGDDEFKPEVCPFSIPSELTLTAVGAYIRGAQQQYARGEISLQAMIDRTNSLHNVMDRREVRTLKAHGGTYEVAHRWEVRYMMGLG